MEVRGPPATSGGDPLGDELDDVVEVRAGHPLERGRPPDEVEQTILGPVLGGALRHDLLRHDVEGRDGLDDGVQAAGPGASKEGSALHELVATGRIQHAPGRAEPGVVRAPHALEERGERSRRADLADQLHRPDVDPELQRCRGHQGLEVARPQPRLHPLAALPREAAVVGRHLGVAEPLPELVSVALRHSPGVDEHQRGPVLLHVPGDAIEDLGHLLGGRHGPQLVVGQLQGEVEVPPVAHVDDGGLR